MAVVMTEERLVASRALMARLREIKSRGLKAGQSQVLTANRPVVLALEDEPLSEFVRRMHAYEPPVLLAVYYPTSQRLQLAELDLAPRVPDTTLVSPETTVGMLLDAEESMSVPDSWETIKVTQLVGG